MSPEHDAMRLQLGAYVLGGLSAADRAAVEAHLASCVACRDELSSFAVVPALLARARDTVRDSAAAEPPPALLPRLVDAVRAERSTVRRRARRLRLATALTAAAAAVALVLSGVALRGPSPDRAPTTPMTAAQGFTASGNAELEARPWGTAIVLDLWQLPRDGRFVAWAVAADGRREQAATWGSTPNGRARVDGATSIPRTELGRVEVVTETGQTVLVTTT
ncbi:zf-HC2 domain-containing protein [Micromonospora sp. NPDC047465]|uniref:zf-HC2 domain-containing protein n=1 Tax=Micromonospora sp. NPDC047465 TaxID=3154813 RepID=UPI0033DD97C6